MPGAAPSVSATAAAPRPTRPPSRLTRAIAKSASGSWPTPSAGPGRPRRRASMSAGTAVSAKPGTKYRVHTVGHAVRGSQHQVAGARMQHRPGAGVQGPSAEEHRADPDATGGHRLCRGCRRRAGRHLRIRLTAAPSAPAAPAAARPP